MTDKEIAHMEKAIEDAMWGFEPNDNGDYAYVDMEGMFEAGAQWQKEQMFNKACKWLEDYLLDYWSQINANNTESFIDNFKKVMGGILFPMYLGRSLNFDKYE